MFELFSDIFAGRDNLLKAVDPRVKLFIALTAVLEVVFSSNPLLPILVFMTCISLAVGIRFPLRLLFLRLIFPLGIVSVVLILKTFMTGGESLYTVSIMGRALNASKEGLWQGIIIGSRVLGSVGVIILLSAVTPGHEVFQTLRYWKISPDWVEMAMLMYRHTFTLIEQTSDIAAAQRCRLGYAGARRSLSSMGTLVGSVLISSFNQGIRIHDAMTVRGYKGYMPFAPMPVLCAKDRWITFIGLTIMLALYLCLEIRW